MRRRFNPFRSKRWARGTYAYRYNPEEIIETDETIMPVADIEPVIEAEKRITPEEFAEAIGATSTTPIAPQPLIEDEGESIAQYYRYNPDSVATDLVREIFKPRRRNPWRKNLRRRNPWHRRNPWRRNVDDAVWHDPSLFTSPFTNRGVKRFRRNPRNRPLWRRSRLHQKPWRSRPTWRRPLTRRSRFRSRLHRRNPLAETRRWRPGQSWRETTTRGWTPSRQWWKEKTARLSPRQAWWKTGQRFYR